MEVEEEETAFLSLVTRLQGEEVRRQETDNLPQRTKLTLTD